MRSNRLADDFDAADKWLCKAQGSFALSVNHIVNGRGQVGSPIERSDEGIDGIWAPLPKAFGDVLPDEGRLRLPLPSCLDAQRPVDVLVDVDLQPLHGNKYAPREA
jgi:hypothetical protein